MDRPPISFLADPCEINLVLVHAPLAAIALISQKFTARTCSATVLGSRLHVVMSTQIRAGVNSAAELDFLANSNFNSRELELELNWLYSARAELELNGNCDHLNWTWSRNCLPQNLNPIQCPSYILSTVDRQLWYCTTWPHLSLVQQLSN